jgi:hypothetical protein
LIHQIANPNRRCRTLLLPRMLYLLAAASQLCSQTAEQLPLRAVELTFLKATPGNRENLKQFIALNWFAMDKIAVAQGLMKEFKVMDTGSDDGAWNVLVSVTYGNPRGYDGVAVEFEKIRAKHKVVLVNGKRMPELGAVVDSRKLYENPAQGSP